MVVGERERGRGCHRPDLVAWAVVAAAAGEPHTVTRCVTVRPVCRALAVAVVALARVVALQLPGGAAAALSLSAGQ